MILEERHALAAFYLRDLPTVVDIGCGRRPISSLLNGEVWSIDPLLPASDDGRVHHLACRFEEWDASQLQPPYGVCLMGILLEMPDDAWQRLFALVAGSELTVVEFPRHFMPSVGQYQRVLEGASRQPWAIGELTTWQHADNIARQIVVLSQGMPRFLTSRRLAIKRYESTMF